MPFYTYSFLENQTHLTNYLTYVLVGAIFLLLLLVGFQYLRHRFETKYRDLIIMLLLVIIFVIGVQYTDYTQTKNNLNQSSQMVNFLERVSEVEKVSTKKIMANQTSLKDGLIVALDGDYYQVVFNSDLTAYTLKDIYLVNPAIEVIDK